MRVSAARAAYRRCQAGRQTHWQLRRLADRLGPGHRRLDELTAGDLDLRASIGLSYRALASQERRAFRRLGMIDEVFTAATLARQFQVPVNLAEDIANRMADASLVGVAGSDASGQVHFEVHELLRL